MNGHDLQGSIQSCGSSAAISFLDRMNLRKSICGLIAAPLLLAGCGDALQAKAESELSQILISGKSWKSKPNPLPGTDYLRDATFTNDGVFHYRYVYVSYYDDKPSGTSPLIQGTWEVMGNVLALHLLVHMSAADNWEEADYLIQVTKASDHLILGVDQWVRFWELSEGGD